MPFKVLCQSPKRLRWLVKVQSVRSIAGQLFTGWPQGDTPNDRIDTYVTGFYLWFILVTVTVKCYVVQDIGLWNGAQQTNVAALLVGM